MLPNTIPWMIAVNFNAISAVAIHCQAPLTSFGESLWVTQYDVLAKTTSVYISTVTVTGESVNGIGLIYHSANVGELRIPLLEAA